MAGAEVLLATIPAELKARPQWVTWRSERREGRPTKIPYAPSTGRRASTTDASSWARFDAAVGAWRLGGYDGIGFAFHENDPYCGVDLDDCLEGAGNLTAEAEMIVQRLDTYAEISPSGRGVKLFLRASLPPGGNRKGKVEIYDRGRYFTVTGRHLTGTPTSIEERQRELEVVHAEIFTSPAPRRPPRPAVALRPPAEDAELLARARSAKNGRKFMGLYYCGDLSAYGGDDSVADLALCGLLAFWCGSDAERIDRLFRQSALMREKWDCRRGATTYGARTIDAALRLRRG